MANTKTKTKTKTAMRIKSSEVSSVTLRAMMDWAYAHRDYATSVDCAKALAGDRWARARAVQAINRNLGLT